MACMLRDCVCSDCPTEMDTDDCGGCESQSCDYCEFDDPERPEED